MYVLLAICSLVMQLIWVNEFVKEDFFKKKFEAAASPKNITIQHYKVTLIVKLVLIFVGYMLAFFALSFVYYIFLNRYN